MATRVTLNIQLGLGQGIVTNTPGCCCVNVVQAVVGAPLLKATACLKHRAERTRRAARTVDIAAEQVLLVVDLYYTPFVIDRAFIRTRRSTRLRSRSWLIELVRGRNRITLRVRMSLMFACGNYRAASSQVLAHTHFSVGLSLFSSLSLSLSLSWYFIHHWLHVQYQYVTCTSTIVHFNKIVLI